MKGCGSVTHSLLQQQKICSRAPSHMTSLPHGASEVGPRKALKVFDKKTSRQEAAHSPVEASATLYLVCDRGELESWVNKL